MRGLAIAALLAAGCASRLLDATDGGAGDSGAMNQGIQYQAFDVPTNQPRLSVQKVDGGKSRCTTILLVGFTSGSPTPGLALPMSWNVERAWQQAITTAGTCSQLTPPTGANTPTAITGSLSFDANNPTTVTVHAQLTFGGGSVEAMDADKIPVKPGSN